MVPGFIRESGDSFNLTVSTVTNASGLMAPPVVVVAHPRCPAVVYIVGSWPVTASGRLVVKLNSG